MSLIGIDCRFVSRTAGLGTYTRELVYALLAVPSTHRFVLFVHADSTSWLSTLPHDRYEAVFVTAQHYSFAEQRDLPAAMRRAGIDVLFAPHFNVPLFCPVPFVVTIHDLILHRFPGNASFLKRVAYRLQMRRSVSSAASIIAVSNFTAQELKSTYGSVVASKIRVIPEGVSSVFVPPTEAEINAMRAKFSLPASFLLYVGNAKSHKNLPMLIQAHRQVPSAATLVLVTDECVQDLLLPSDRITVLSQVDDLSLRSLYGAAEAFVTPSLYEGFCLPVLEARACGCPIIAMNVSATPEVAGAHALLVEPNLPSLCSALEHPPVHADAPETDYDWSYTAAQTASILDSHC